jgi:hypothetical protein
MAERKPDHPFIDDAVNETIEFVVTREWVHNSKDVRRAAQRGARRVAGYHGMRLDEVRWIVRKVCIELGA